MCASPKKCQKGCWDHMKVQKLNRGRAAAVFIDYLEGILFKQITLYFATLALNILNVCLLKLNFKSGIIKASHWQCLD